MQIHVLRHPFIEKVLLLIDKRWQTIEKFAIILLCLSPILQHYKGIVSNAGISVLILLAPFFFLRQISQLEKLNYKVLLPIIPLVLFTLYKMLLHGFTFKELIYSLLMIFYYIVAASGIINLQRFIKVAARIAILSVALIVLQYISFYIFRFHLQLIPTSLLSEGSNQWILLAQTGLISITGKPTNFYRPSSFFIEPSHMFLYLIPILALVLLSPKMDKRRLQYAIILTIGLFLSTSGMGIVSALGIWGVYSATHLIKSFNYKTLAVITGIFILVVLVFLIVPFLRESIGRILFGQNGSGSAISGRTASGMKLVQSLKGSAFWVGTSDKTDNISYHLAGFVNTMYRYGLIGTVLSYVFYLYSMFKLKHQYFWFGALLLVMSFFTAHTHGTFYMMYFVFIFLYGFQKKQDLHIESLD